MRTSTVSTRVVTVFAEQIQLSIAIIHIVSEIRALILLITIVLIQLEFIVVSPLALEALGWYLGATF